MSDQIKYGRTTNIYVPLMRVDYIEDGFYVCELGHTDDGDRREWLIVSNAYSHKTSAYAALGRRFEVHAKSVVDSFFGKDPEDDDGGDDHLQEEEWSVASNVPEDRKGEEL